MTLWLPPYDEGPDETPRHYYVIEAAYSMESTVDRVNKTIYIRARPVVGDLVEHANENNETGPFDCLWFDVRTGTYFTKVNINKIYTARAPMIARDGGPRGTPRRPEWYEIEGEVMGGRAYDHPDYNTEAMVSGD